MVEGDAGGAGGEEEDAGEAAAADVGTLPSFMAVRYLERGS